MRHSDSESEDMPSAASRAGRLPSSTELSMSLLSASSSSSLQSGTNMHTNHVMGTFLSTS